jgi:hypothetical protein
LLVGVLKVARVAVEVVYMGMEDNKMAVAAASTETEKHIDMLVMAVVVVVGYLAC